MNFYLIAAAIIVVAAENGLQTLDRGQPLILAPPSSPLIPLFAPASFSSASSLGALREELAAHLVQNSSKEFGVFPHETFVDDVQDANADNDDDRGNGPVGYGLIVAG